MKAAGHVFAMIEIQERVRLGPLTTLGVGGEARFFARSRTAAEVQKAIAFAHARKLKLFVMGGGSNLLISDRGWDGLVLQVAIAGIEERGEDPAVFDVGAGVDWDEFVSHAVTRNCAGIECLSGIPGSVGGTPIQNVGAYGQEVSGTIVSMLAFDLVENRVRELKVRECAFGYRTSVFNTSQRGRYVVLQVTYKLEQGGAPALHYIDLQKHFAGPADPTLSEVREAVLEIRSRKGMVLQAGDPGTAGSFFKNPVLSDEDYKALLARAAQRHVQVPSYPALSQQHKISAAWLVENSGFSKGWGKGNVGISSQHSLALVNRGGATANEIVALKDEIQAKVDQEWGVRLEPEPVFVGF